MDEKRATSTMIRPLYRCTERCDLQVRADILVISNPALLTIFVGVIRAVLLVVIDDNWLGPKKNGTVALPGRKHAMKRGSKPVVRPDLDRVTNVDHKRVLDRRNEDLFLLLLVKNLQRGHIIVLKVRPCDERRP